MSGERKPGWFWHLDRWNLGIAGVLLAIIVVVGAIILINDRPKAVPRPATPVAVVPTPGPTAAAPGSQAIASGNLAGTATALPPAQAGAATAASGTAAAGTAAAGTAATQQGMLTAAPGAGQATPPSPVSPPAAGTIQPAPEAQAVTPAAVQPGTATQPAAATQRAAATQTGPSALNSTPGGPPVAGTTVTPAAANLATPANAQAAAVPAAATPAAAVTTVAATPVAARTPVRLGNLSVVPPVFVPEAEFPVSVPGAPALGSLAGSAPPGSVISIFDGNTLLGQVRAGADGQWRFPVPSTLSPGRHVLTAVFAAAGAAAGAAPGSRPLMIVLSVPVIVSAAGEAHAALEAAAALSANAPLLPISGVDLAGPIAAGWDRPWTGVR